MKEHQDPTFNTHLQKLIQTVNNMGHTKEATTQQQEQQDSEEDIVTRAEPAEKVSEAGTDDEGGEEEAARVEKVVKSSKRARNDDDDDDAEDDRPDRRPENKEKPTKANAEKRAEEAAKPKKKRKKDKKCFKDAEDYVIRMYYDIFAPKDTTPTDDGIDEGAAVFKNHVKAVLEGAKTFATNPDDNYSHLYNLCLGSCSLDFVRTKKKDTSIAVFKSIDDKEVRYAISSGTIRFVMALFYMIHLDKYIILKIKEACEGHIIIPDMIENTPFTLLEMENGGFHRGLVQKLVSQLVMLKKDLLAISEYEPSNENEKDEEEDDDDDDNDAEE